ncbi:hypothetical protein, partial [Escherichia coli]|uniref:hypothetical protein n=1 Tax=Escherichia coli TaxID=562 RepID=UPI0013871DC8
SLLEWFLRRFFSHHHPLQLLLFGFLFLTPFFKEFLSRDYYSEPMFEGNEIKGKMRVDVVKKVREFRTWYEDACHNFGTHARGVAGNMLGDAILLKKYKEKFGIPGETIIDETGQNLDDYLFDEFVRDGEKSLWCSEWKAAYLGEDISSCLTEAKNTLRGQIERYIKEGSVKVSELP